MVQCFCQNQVPHKGEIVPMQKIVSIIYPKCNNQKSFYRYGKDCDGYQKYQCRNCRYQFAPERSSEAREERGKLVGFGGGTIRPVLSAVKRASYTMTMITTTTTAAVTNAATTHLSFGSRVVDFDNIPFSGWPARSRLMFGFCHRLPSVLGSTYKTVN